MLSNTCRYGIRAVVYLASQPDAGEKTGIKKISKELDIPMPFLAKILQQLAKQKLLSSTKGPHGGFALLKDPHTISLLDIVYSIDGYDTFSGCIMHNGTCEGFEKDKKLCPLHEEYNAIRKGIIQLFSSMTVYDLVKISDNTEKISI